jgi:acetolactate synthase-1/2/3 large subunit
LETALRCGINTVTIVNNNNAFGQCWEGIHDVYGDDPSREDLYLFKPINFANFASDMGCLGIRIEDPTQIRPALERAVNENKPALLDVVTDWKAVAPYPPMPPQPEELFMQ